MCVIPHSWTFLRQAMTERYSFFLFLLAAREDLLGLGVRGLGRLLHAILAAQCAHAVRGAFQVNDGEFRLAIDNCSHRFFFSTCEVAYHAFFSA